MQTYIYENSTNNSNNNNNLIHNKTEPLIGPKLKKESKIRNIINLKNNNVIKNKPNNINNNRINNKINTNKNNNNNVSEHICKIINVGKNINNNQFKIIIDASIKACLTLNGKIMTATKACCCARPTAIFPPHGCGISWPARWRRDRRSCTRTTR